MIFFRAAMIVFVLAGSLALPQGAFAKEKKPKVSELLKDANDFMSQAQTAYIDGQSKQAIELYRKALAEISRVEKENASLAASSEFAPVRFRKALCETEIDRIMLEEVNATARTVAVTDTSALEAKRQERKKAAETNNMPEAAVKLAAKQGVAKEPAGSGEKADPKDGAAAATQAGADAGKPVVVADELEWAKDMISVDRFSDAEKSLMAILKQSPEHREARFLLALSRVREGRNADAAVIIDDLLADNPKDQAVLLLSAGSQLASGSYSKAMETLDKAMKADPKRPDGYLNMAWLLLEMNPKESAESELYYRQAIKLGGSRDRDIERRLGIKQN